MRGSPGVLFLYKYRRVLDRKGPFFFLDHLEKVLQEELFHFTIKNHMLSAGGSSVDFFKGLLWASWI